MTQLATAGVGRKILFTPDVLRKIPEWVMLGKDEAWIATKIGCTPDSLVATCSKHRISLSRSKMIAATLLPKNATHPLPLTRVTFDCWQALVSKADRLHLQQDWLITLILEHVVKHGKIDAIVAAEKKGKT